MPQDWARIPSSALVNKRQGFAAALAINWDSAGDSPIVYSSAARGSIAYNKEEFGEGHLLQRWI